MDSQQIPQQVNSYIDAAKHERWMKYCFIGLFVAAGLFFLWNRFKPAEELASHTPVIAQEAKKAVKVSKRAIAGPKQLEVYDRQDLLKKIPVPADVATDTANQFTATAEIPAMPYGGQAVTYVNYSTYKTGITLQANKRPLLGFGGRTKIGAIGGISNLGNIAVGYVNQDIVRIGPVNIGGTPLVGVIGDKALFGIGAHIHGEF